MPPTDAELPLIVNAVQPKPIANRAVPMLVVFTASTCVMIVELVASRLLAQHLGSNLYTWTGIIGVVLAGLAVGNLFGGSLAERSRQEARTALAFLLVVAGIFVMLTTVAVTPLFSLPLIADLPIPQRVLIGTTTLFFVPSALLGTVSPLAATWVLTSSPQLGSLVGQVYAVGSLGAIVGTFLTGFVLIGVLGSTPTLLIVGALLATLALLAKRNRYTLLGVSTALVLAAALAYTTRDAYLSVRGRDIGDVIYADETPYQTVAIARDDEHGVLAVVLDNLVHGYVLPDSPTSLVYPYIALYAAAYESLREKQLTKLRSLHLGGGAFTMARYIDAAFEDDPVTVVEIDPGVTSANQVAANLGDPIPFEVLHEDAREAVRRFVQADRKFDIVFGDAFKDYSIPAHLATVQYYEMIDRVLSDDGMLLQNVIDDLSRPRVLAAIAHTVSQVHTNVLILSTTAPEPVAGRSTYVIASSNKPIDVSSIRIKMASLGQPFFALTTTDLNFLLDSEQPTLLTDDYSPVEWLVSHLY